MDEIKIPLGKLKEVDLTITEYLTLYNLANGFCISYKATLEDYTGLEKKGFVKLTSNGIFLRDKAQVLFSKGTDLFEEWLEAYPTQVQKKFGGTRALSPSSADTILGKTLRKKWDSIFKKDIEEQKKAITVLKKQVKQMEDSGDLEYMVEARRWLNEGYHEKYSYLLDEEDYNDDYISEDYL